MRRLSRMLEHRTLDVKSLRSALKNRDTQLDAAIERIKELELLLLRSGGKHGGEGRVRESREAMTESRSRRRPRRQPPPPLQEPPKA